MPEHVVGKVTSGWQLCSLSYPQVDCGHSSEADTFESVALNDNILTQDSTLCDMGDMIDSPIIEDVARQERGCASRLTETVLVVCFPQASLLHWVPPEQHARKGHFGHRHLCTKISAEAPERHIPSLRQGRQNLQQMDTYI